MNHIKTGGVFRCSRMVSISCSTCDTRRVTVKRHEHHLIWMSCCTTVCVNIWFYCSNYLAMSVPDEGYWAYLMKVIERTRWRLLSVPDEGYWAYLMKVIERTWWRLLSVPDEGYGRNASCALNLLFFINKTWTPNRTNGSHDESNIVLTRKS